MPANGPQKAVRQETKSWKFSAVLTVGMISSLLASLSPLLRDQPSRAPIFASSSPFAHFEPQARVNAHPAAASSRPSMTSAAAPTFMGRSITSTTDTTPRNRGAQSTGAASTSPPASRSVYWSPGGDVVRQTAAFVTPAFVTPQGHESIAVPSQPVVSLSQAMIVDPKHAVANPQASNVPAMESPQDIGTAGQAVAADPEPIGIHRGGTLIQLGPPVVSREAAALPLPPAVQVGSAPSEPRTANLQAPVPPATNPASNFPSNPPSTPHAQPAEVLPPLPSTPVPPPNMPRALQPGAFEPAPASSAPGNPEVVRKGSQGNELWEVNGDKITMHLDEVPVRRVLEMFSRSHSMNILVAPGVAGTVTANFEGVTIDEAVDAVLQLCRLSAQKRANMMFVHADSEVPNEDLQLQVFPLDFASAESLLPTVQSLMSPSGKAFPSQLGPAQDNRQSADGKQSPRWNPEALVVTDLPANLARVAAYIQKMDRSPKQVLIEAHVLEVELDQDQRHGVNYSHILGDFRVAVDGMAATTTGPTFFATVDTSKVASLLECLRTTANSKTLASPRVMVVNGETARIQVGQQLGYKVVTTTQAAAVEEVKFLEVGVVLQVTPRITRDNRILMRVRPKVSSGEVDPETLLPQEQTREVETDVMLTDGQGVVIGGLIEEDDRDVLRVIPYIVNVPVVGKLLSKRVNETRRSEIVITLIPRVVHCPPGAPLIGAEEVHGRPVAGAQCYPGEVNHAPPGTRPVAMERRSTPRSGVSGYDAAR